MDSGGSGRLRLRRARAEVRLCVRQGAIAALAGVDAADVQGCCSAAAAFEASMGGTSLACVPSAVLASVARKRLGRRERVRLILGGAAPPAADAAASAASALAPAVSSLRSGIVIAKTGKRWYRLSRRLSF